MFGGCPMGELCGGEMSGSHRGIQVRAAVMIFVTLVNTHQLS